MGGGLGLIAIIGAVVLGAILLFAVLRNRQRTPAEERRTERATSDLYQAQDAQDKRDELAP